MTKYCIDFLLRRSGGAFEMENFDFNQLQRFSFSEKFPRSRFGVTWNSD